ncbi:MAG: aspartate kinase [Coriobacteriales bacterium]|nr:aspartate kinase [Coriobacteriales bacterium]
MSLIVMKFGGTSVANGDRIKNVADRIIRQVEAGDKVIAVVSAMGKMTDDLVAIANQVTDNPPSREMDVLLSAGEQISMSILAMAIDAKGHVAKSFTGAQAGIITDGGYTKARIEQIDASRLKEALREGNIVIVAGFQGVTKEGDITTLGRGGSDTTAVAVAAAVGADVCEIYTDVDGVYTTDPRIDPKARKIDEISYEEMLELADSGAGVLQSRSVEFARNFGVVIHCRSAFSDEPGTLVKEVSDMESAVISGIAYDDSEAKVTLRGVPDQPGIAAMTFSKVSEIGANVDMIVQNKSENGLTDLSFTTPSKDLPKVTEILDAMVKDLGARSYVVDESIAKISLVGAGMKSHPGVAAKMFSVLAENQINISLISTSPIRISVIIDGEQKELAVNCLHTAFDLDSDSLFEETQLSSEELEAKAQKGR